MKHPGIIIVMFMILPAGLLASSPCFNTFSPANNRNILITADNDNDKDHKFTFILGIGLARTRGHLYLMPAINPSTDAVIFEFDSRLRTNASLGIVFTPNVKYKLESQPNIIILESVMTNIEVRMTEMVPYGFSIAVFMNPLTIDFAKSGLNNSIDFGVGIGYRFGDFSAFLTAEAFMVRQPREYFIELYKNKPYIVDNSVQKSLDINDNNIFYDKLSIAVGLKIAYNINLIKKFKTESKTTQKKVRKSDYEMKW